MEYKKQLIGRIESFYVDVVEEFKEAELQIMAEFKISQYLQEKDYDGNIAKLRSCKKDAQKIRTTDLQIPKKDKTAAEVFVFLRQAYASSMRCATPISVCRML